MNYTNIYNNLIAKASSREIVGYTEMHHIIPRCMGGLDKNHNLVALTPEEHFVAHQLLVRMHPSNHKLIYAANMMNNRVANNKQYGWIKRKFSEVERIAKTGVPRTAASIQKQRDTINQKYANGYVSPALGRPLSEEHKQRISEGNLGKQVPIESRSSLAGHILRYGETEGHRLYAEHNVNKDSKSLDAFIKRHGETEGPVKYNEYRHKMSERMAGENHPLFGIGHTEATRQKISASKTGKKIARSAEHNAKIGAANKGKKPPMDTCIHCGMHTSTTNIKRWHNDNCKHK